MKDKRYRDQLNYLNQCRNRKEGEETMQFQKKYTLVLILTLIIAMMLTACGAAEPAAPEAPAEQPQEEAAEEAPAEEEMAEEASGGARRLTGSVLLVDLWW
jgi:hypothetical protein